MPDFITGHVPDLLVYGPVCGGGVDARGGRRAIRGR